MTHDMEFRYIVAALLLTSFSYDTLLGCGCWPASLSCYDTLLGCGRWPASLSCCDTLLGCGHLAVIEVGTRLEEGSGDLGPFHVNIWNAIIKCGRRHEYCISAYHKVHYYFLLSRSKLTPWLTALMRKSKTNLTTVVVYSAYWAHVGMRKGCQNDRLDYVWTAFSCKWFSVVMGRMSKSSVNFCTHSLPLWLHTIRITSRTKPVMAEQNCKPVQ